MGIEHVFVLMMENRSFDHMLGFSGLPGVPEPPARFGFQRGALNELQHDPPHEFEDVAAQINGGAMDGFGPIGADGMRGFSPDAIEMLWELARDNLYFDNWYSSMPGPTWPNRLFAHAASSGGLDNSMSLSEVIDAITKPERALQFDNGHVFQRLTGKGVKWRVYHHQGGNIDYPQVLSLQGMVALKNDQRFFRHFDDFASDMQRGDVVGYTFIEPRYGLLANYRTGNSQHPVGSITRGEQLIKAVYEAIFGRAVGKKSALLITWDEHGGFFDHKTPPAAAPPGDRPWNHDRAADPGDCPFDRFGVRVPAVLISPWLKNGLGSRIFGTNAHFDHSSIVRALRTTFSLGREMTNRDKASPDWNAALRSTPRKLRKTLRSVSAPKRRAAPSLKEIAASGPPSGNLIGMTEIAIEIDWHASERLRMQPLICSEYEQRLKRAQKILSEPAASVAGPEMTAAHLAILEYLVAVQKRDAKLQAVERKLSGLHEPLPKPGSKRAAKRGSKKRRSRPRGRKR